MARDCGNIKKASLRTPFFKNNIVKKEEDNTKNIESDLVDIEAEIFQAIISKDAKKLKSFFKPSIQDKEKIDAEIEEMLKFIEGNVVSYSDIKDGIGRGSKEYFTIVFEEKGYRIYDVKTDAGRTYHISYSIVKIDKDNPNDLGMTSIGIYDKDTYDSKKGYPYSGQYIVGEEEKDVVETVSSKHIPRKFFNAVLSKDKESLKKLMTEDLQKLEETDIQINKFFEFIDGKIESYSEARSEVRGNVKNQMILLEGIVSNIKTDTGKNYEIGFEYIDGMGIYKIILMDSDLYDKRKGKPTSARTYIGDIFYLFNNDL